MSSTPRRHRQYTVEGGWSRNPTAFERARDLAVDAAAAIGRAAARFVLYPNPTAEERRQQMREARMRGDWRYVAPEKTPIHQRLRLGRIGTAAVVAALATAGLATTHEAPPLPVQTAPLERGPVLTDEQRESLKATYVKLQEFWAGHNIDPGQVNLVLLDGRNTYECDQSTVVTGNDPSMYCGATNTILITSGSLSNWAHFMGEQGAERYILGHEYGHAVQDLEGDNNPQSQATERSADCWAGFFIGADYPESANIIYTSILTYGLEDAAHGAPKRLAAAYGQGVAGGPCDSTNFMNT